MASPQKAVESLIDMLHESDDHVMDIDSGLTNPDQKFIFNLMQSSLESAYRNALNLMKKLNEHPCPECGGIVETNVCQSAACKERLL